MTYLIPDLPSYESSFDADIDDFLKLFGNQNDSIITAPDLMEDLIPITGSSLRDSDWNPGSSNSQANWNNMGTPVPYPAYLSGDITQKHRLGTPRFVNDFIVDTSAYTSYTQTPACNSGGCSPGNEVIGLVPAAFLGSKAADTSGSNLPCGQICQLNQPSSISNTTSYLFGSSTFSATHHAMTPAVRSSCYIGISSADLNLSQLPQVECLDSMLHVPLTSPVDLVDFTSPMHMQFSSPANSSGRVTGSVRPSPGDPTQMLQKRSSSGVSFVPFTIRADSATYSSVVEVPLSTEHLWPTSNYPAPITNLRNSIEQQMATDTPHGEGPLETLHAAQTHHFPVSGSTWGPTSDVFGSMAFVPDETSKEVLAGLSSESVSSVDGFFWNRNMLSPSSSSMSHPLSDADALMTLVTEEEDHCQGAAKKARTDSGPSEMGTQLEKTVEKRILTLAILQEVYHLPSEEAADKLGIGKTMLKKLCRAFNVHRWPYRKIDSVNKLIIRFQGEDQSDPDVEKVMQELLSMRKAIYEDPSIPLDEDIKWLRQSNFKLEHKERQLELLQQQRHRSQQGSF